MTHDTREVPLVTRFTCRLAGSGLFEGKGDELQEHINWLADEVHHQLQKARHDWLREEIVWLKNEHAHSFGETATTLEIIIDRYHSELDQDNK